MTESSLRERNDESLKRGHQRRHLLADLFNHFFGRPGTDAFQLANQCAADDDAVGGFAQVLDMLRLADAEADAQGQICLLRSQRSCARAAGGSALRSPVMPTTLTQYKNPVESWAMRCARSGGVVGVTS